MWLWLNRGQQAKRREAQRQSEYRPRADSVVAIETARGVIRGHWEVDSDGMLLVLMLDTDKTDSRAITQRRCYQIYLKAKLLYLLN